MLLVLQCQETTSGEGLRLDALLVAMQENTLSTGGAKEMGKALGGG